QQNKSTIVRLRSFVCIADDAPEKRVNMSSPEYYLRSFVCIADDAPEKRVNMSSPEYYSRKK
ncbi:hypothetical protein ACRWG2_25720, partial [Escherichia coli]